MTTITTARPAAISIRRSPTSPSSSVPWIFSAQANQVWSLSTSCSTCAVYGSTATASVVPSRATTNQLARSGAAGAMYSRSVACERSSSTAFACALTGSGAWSIGFTVTTGPRRVWKPVKNTMTSPVRASMSRKGTT